MGKKKRKIKEKKRRKKIIPLFLEKQMISERDIGRKLAKIRTRREKKRRKTKGKQRKKDTRLCQRKICVYVCGCRGRERR